MSDVPPKLGKYDIVRALGEGAMGTVYEAVDSVIERTVAIKTIRKSGFDAEEASEHSRRFLIEAKASAKLNHPHIVGLYDHGDEAGLAYIVMELVQGRELQHYFDEKFAFALGDVVRLMGELLDALGYSHRRGVVHRDVKPANIFITDTGAVKLGDFGIARIESSQKTRVDAVVGTPSYMSPEQIRGEPADARSDLYAAGVVLYQFLTGERPYSGNMLTMAIKVLNEPVPRPSAIQPDISPQLEAVVMRALAKDARDRYQTAAEFWQALASAVGQALPSAKAFAALPGNDRMPTREAAHGGTGGPDDSGTGRSMSRMSRMGADPPEAMPPPVRTVPAAAAPNAPRPARSSASRVLMGAAALAAVALGLAAWWFTTRGSGALPAPSPGASVPAPSSSTARPPEPAVTVKPVSTAGEPAASAVPAASQATPAPAAVSSPVTAGKVVSEAPSSSPTATEAPRPASAPASAAADPPHAPNSAPHQRPVREPRTPPQRPPGAPAPSTTPASPVIKAARPARCSDILQKASLEPLSAEEAAFLRRECR